METSTVGAEVAETVAPVVEETFNEETWRDGLETNATPADDEDETAMAAFYGENWREVLGIPAKEETTVDTATTGDGTDTTTGNGEGDTVDPSTATSGEGEGSGETKPELEGAPTATELATADEIKQLAELGKQWKHAFATDPKKAMSELLNSPAFTAEDKAEMFRGVQQAELNKATKIDPESYEPASDFEKSLLGNMDWLRDGETKVAEALQSRDRDIQHTFVETQANAALLESICEFIGFKAPKHDTNAIFAHFDKTPEGSLQDAVTKVYRETVLREAKLQKQSKEAARPNTPRGGSSIVAPRVINSMSEAWDQAGIELGLVD